MDFAMPVEDWEIESMPPSELASLDLSSPSELTDDVPVLSPTSALPDCDNTLIPESGLEPTSSSVLDSIVPLIQEIQSSLVVEDNEFHIVNEPTKVEWENLIKSARRVVELTISDTTLPKISATIFFKLGQLQDPSKPIFPALQKLRIINTTPSSIPYLDLFFAPSLRSLNIKGVTSSSNNTVVSLLKKLSSQSPMSELVLDSICISSEICTAIGQCLHLTSLKLRNLTGKLDYAFLAVIGSLPHLQIFGIETTDIVEFLSLTMSVPAAHKYLCLHDFSFVGNFSTLQFILRNLLGAPLLRKAHIEVIKYEPDIPQRARTVIRRLQMENSIVNEVVNQIVGGRQEILSELTFIVPGLPHFPAEIVGTVSKLQNLTHLNVSGRIIAKLDNTLRTYLDDEEEMLTWSKLTTLRFHLPMMNVDSENAVSLGTLQLIAMACPNLRLFQGPVAIPDVPQPWSVALDSQTHPVVSHGLKTLIFGAIGTSAFKSCHVPLSIAHYITWFLYAMFPNVDIEVGCREPDNSYQFWSEVSGCMKLCRGAREIDARRDKSNAAQ